jgi:hypothetical protein
MSSIVILKTCKLPVAISQEPFHTISSTKLLLKIHFLFQSSNQTSQAQKLPMTWLATLVFEDSILL